MRLVNTVATIICFCTSFMLHQYYRRDISKFTSIKTIFIMSNRFILHSNTPLFDEMTCIICSIDNEEKRDKSAVSSFHWQILKCRMLIFSTSKLIVSPEATDNSKIIIIFVRKTMNIQQLQMILNKLNIKITLSMEVNPNLFEACYKYTLSAKLSPSWNLMETNLFISGRDFLTNQQPSDAVMLNVNVSRETVTLEVKCFRARLGQMSIDNLNILQRNLDYFSNIPDASLSEMSLLDQWVHVIPSMKKARIISVNKKIPASSPFTTYKDLKRHWKNIYGYRLPESDTDLIYYEVHFRPLGPNLYTYPSVCLRPRPPLLTSPTQIHAREILNQFMTDLHNRMPSVLNNIMKFDFPDEHTMKLPMTNIENAPKPDDLTIYKPREHHVEEIFTDINFHDNWNASVDSQIANTTQHVSLCTPTQNVSIEVEKKEDVSRIKPVFISKRITKKENIIELTAINKSLKNIEIISPVDTCEKRNNIFESHVWPDEIHVVSPCTAKNTTIPTFSSKISKLIKFAKTPTIKTKATLKPKIAHKTTVKKVTTPVINTVKEVALSQDIKSNPSFSVQTLDTDVHIADRSSLTQICLVDLDGKNFGQSSLNSQKSKRKVESGKPVIPKKPKLEVNLAAIDIPGLAMRDMSALKKLNAQTLIAWLRSQNIPATTRMLKQQLLNKVLEKLQINQAPITPV